MLFLCTDNQENNISESEKKNETRIQLYNVTSEIHLQPSVEDDAINYTCEAVHEALPPWKRLRATVQLSVLCKYLCNWFLEGIRMSSNRFRNLIGSIRVV